MPDQGISSAFCLPPERYLCPMNRPARSAVFPERGVGPGFQFERLGYLVEQSEQLRPFLGAERLAQSLFEFFRQLEGLPEELLPRAGQTKAADASVTGMRSPLEQLSPFELVDDGD